MTIAAADTCAAPNSLALLDEIQRSLTVPSALQIDVIGSMANQSGTRMSYEAKLVITADNRLSMTFSARPGAVDTTAEVGQLWARSDGHRMLGELALGRTSTLDAETPPDLRDRLLRELVRRGCLGPEGVPLVEALRQGEVTLFPYAIHEVRDVGRESLDGRAVRVIAFGFGGADVEKAIDVTLKVDVATGFPVERESRSGTTRLVERYTIQPVPEPPSATFTFDRGASDSVIELAEKTDAVSFLSFDSNGALLAGTSDDGELRIWSLVDRKERLRSSLGDGAITAIAIDPTRGRIVTAPRWPLRRLRLGDEVLSRDQSAIRLLDPITGKQVGRLVAHEGDVHALAVAQLRPLLASAGSDRTVRIWDLEYRVESRR